MEDTTTGLALQVTDLQNDNALQDDRLAALESSDIVLEERVRDLEAAVNGSSNPNVTGNVNPIELNDILIQPNLGKTFLEVGFPYVTFLTSLSELTERVEALEGVTSHLLSDVTDLESSDADIIERLEVLEAAIIGNNILFES